MLLCEELILLVLRMEFEAALVEQANTTSDLAKTAGNQIDLANLRIDALNASLVHSVAAEATARADAIANAVNTESSRAKVSNSATSPN